MRKFLFFSWVRFNKCIWTQKFKYQLILLVLIIPMLPFVVDFREYWIKRVVTWTKIQCAGNFSAKMRNKNQLKIEKNKKKNKVRNERFDLAFQVWEKIVLTSVRKKNGLTEKLCLMKLDEKCLLLSNCKASRKFYQVC